MEIGHSHSHSGGNEAHSHGIEAPKDFNSAFAIGVALNLAFVALEAGYGYKADSLALIADAGHNLSDVLGLLLAWGASVLSRRKPSKHYTYGLKSSSILAALANAVVLLVAIGGIGWEAIQRFSSPNPVSGGTVMAVAGAGILVNGVTALLFSSGRKGDLNIRGAYLHMLADALVSVAVVAAGAAIYYSGLLWIDPVVSLAVCGVIMVGTWGLLKDSLKLALNAVPGSIDVAGVEAFLQRSKGVSAIHDLHIWAMSTTENALTVHLVMTGGHPGDDILNQLTHEIRERFNIGHSTIQVELGNGSRSCALSSRESV